MDISSGVTSGDEEVSSLMLSEDSTNCDKSSEDLHGDDNEDTRSELKFDQGKYCNLKTNLFSHLFNWIQALETEDEKAKRCKIEEALNNKKTGLHTWRQLAIEKYGLVNGS